MRGLLVIVLCCVSGFQIAQSHNQRSGHEVNDAHPCACNSRRTISLPPSKPIHLRGVIGTLPEKYHKLSKIDELAAYKAGSVFTLALHAVFPNSYRVSRYGPIDIDLPGSWIRGQLYLSNLIVNGIHSTVLQQLQMRTKNNRIDFSAIVPAISASANFEIEGNIGYVPIFLTGTLSLSEQSLNLSGAIKVNKVKNHPYHGERYQVVAGDVAGDIQDINITLEDTDVNTDLNFLKEQVIEKTKDKVAQLIMGTVFEEVNKVLEKIPAAEIYKFLTEYY